MEPNTPNDIPTKPLGNPVAPITENPNKGNTTHPSNNPTHNESNSPNHNQSNSPTHKESNNTTHNQTNNPSKNQTHNPANSQTNNPANNPANTSHNAPKSGLTSPKDQHSSLNADSHKGDKNTVQNDSKSIKENWNQLKGLLKSNYPKLTDADLSQMESKPDHLSASIQTKVGDTRENIDAFIQDSLQEITNKA